MNWNEVAELHVNDYLDLYPEPEHEGPHPSDFDRQPEPPARVVAIELHESGLFAENVTLEQRDPDGTPHRFELSRFGSLRTGVRSFGAIKGLARCRNCRAGRGVTADGMCVRCLHAGGSR